MTNKLFDWFSVIDINVTWSELDIEKFSQSTEVFLLVVNPLKLYVKRNVDSLVAAGIHVNLQRDILNINFLKLFVFHS